MRVDVAGAVAAGDVVEVELGLTAGVEVADGERVDVDIAMVGAGVKFGVCVCPGVAVRVGLALGVLFGLTVRVGVAVTVVVAIAVGISVAMLVGVGVSLRA